MSSPVIARKDKAVVRAVAERLRADGLRVWLDDWEIRPGDSIPAKIEEGLEPGSDSGRSVNLGRPANVSYSLCARPSSGMTRVS
jgi:hypothetical protein